MRIIGLEEHFTTPEITQALQNLPPPVAVPLARQANDRLAAAVKAHPYRFSGFATLPTSDPATSALELERCVQELVFSGR